MQVVGAIQACTAVLRCAGLLFLAFATAGIISAQSASRAGLCGTVSTAKLGPYNYCGSRASINPETFWAAGGSRFDRTAMT